MLKFDGIDVLTAKDENIIYDGKTDGKQSEEGVKQGFVKKLTFFQKCISKLLTRICKSYKI